MEKNKSLSAALVALLVIAAYFVYFSGDEEFETEPVTNDGAPWRIGYYEGGPYVNYPEYLRYLTYGLMELGWIEEATLPYFEDENDAEVLWTYLANNLQSDYIVFVEGAFWSAEWDNELRNYNRSDAIQRLAAHEVDMVLAMGTWAGMDLATDEHDVPTLVISASDPLGAGIIESELDSGHDHVHVKVNHNLYINQINLFYDIFKFERLGVVYEDTVEGHAYANLNELREMSEMLDFELVECIAPEQGFTDEECKEFVVECYTELAPQIDALWVGLHKGEGLVFIPEILQPLYKDDIPTWSSQGAQWVEKGVLMSICRKDLSHAGEWEAEVIAKIFNGATPRDLEQRYEEPLLIAVNLEAARQIGYVVPESLLAIADEIFYEIGE